MSERTKLPKWVAPAAAVALGLAACSSQAAAQGPKPRPAATADRQPGATPSPVVVHESETKVGYDVSYPQCGQSLPSRRAFGVVGVNGGYANNFNPCLASEFAWAQASAGNSSQRKAQLYIWGANPGKNYEGTVIQDWPTTGTNQFGACDGSDGPACSFQYGFNKGSADIRYAKQQLGAAVLVRNTVYIDVEADTGPASTGTWQTTSPLNNLAAIEGFAAAVSDNGDTPGIYSDATQFQEVVGESGARSLAKDPEWVTGGGTVVGAREDCSSPFIEGAKVALSQYQQDGTSPDTPVSPVRLDYAC